MSPECYVMQERGTGIEARRGNLSRKAVNLIGLLWERQQDIDSESVWGNACQE